MLHNGETVLTFTEAASRLPRLNGKKVHSSSVWRWARKGLGGIHLETRRIGGRFVTSIEALERFTKALAEVPLQKRDVSAPRAVKPRTSKQRERAIAQADRELAEAGIE